MDKPKNIENQQISNISQVRMRESGWKQKNVLKGIIEDMRKNGSIQESEDYLVKKIEKYEANFRDKIVEEENSIASNLEEVSKKSIDRNKKLKQVKNMQSDLANIIKEIDAKNKNIERINEVLTKLNNKQEEYIQVFSQEKLDQLLNPTTSEELIDQGYLNLREQLAKDKDPDIPNKTFSYVREQNIDRDKALNTDTLFEYKGILRKKHELTEFNRHFITNSERLARDKIETENRIKIVNDEIKCIETQLSHIQENISPTKKPKTQSDIDIEVNNGVLEHIKRKKSTREGIINELNETISTFESLKIDEDKINNYRINREKATKEAKLLKNIIKKYQEG